MTLTVKDMLRLVCCGVNLFSLYIVILALDLLWLAPPNRVQPWPSPGYLVAVGLMSAWILFQVVPIASRIIRGDGQKKEGGNV